MNLFLARAIWRTCEIEHTESWDALLLACEKQGIKATRATVKGDALISRARSIAASAFLRSHCQVMLFIDGDIWFQEQDALTLADKCFRGKDVIGALYMTRSLQTQPAIMLPDKAVDLTPDSPPVPVPFISTGFLAIHRRVLESLARDLPLCHQGWRNRGVDTSFWPFFMPFCIPWEGDGHLYLSEDWAFCQRAKDAGFQVWLDPSIRLAHVGTYMFTLEDLLRPERIRPTALRMHRAKDGQLETRIMEAVDG